MQISTVINILWRRKWVILVTTALALAVAAVVTSQIEPSYEVRALLRATTPRSAGLPRLDYADRLNNTYDLMVKSRIVREELMKRLDIEESEIPKMGISVVANSEMMELVVEHYDPVIANTVADILIEKNSELYFGRTFDELKLLEKQLEETELELQKTITDYIRETGNDLSGGTLPASLQTRLSLIQGRYNYIQNEYENAYLRSQQEAETLYLVNAAEPPKAPNSPKPMLNMAIGGALGLIAGLGLAFIFENMDTKLYSTHQIEELTGIKTVGKIPTGRPLRIGLNLSEDYTQVEAYRKLRTNLFTTSGDMPVPHTLLIASASPEEGKSVITSNLAVMIAQAGQKVLVVDGDMRRPKQHLHFNLNNEIGLSSVLSGEVALQDAIQLSQETHVYILPSGQTPPHPTEMLATPEMRAIIEQLRQNYDVILFDSPALLSVADSTVLSSFMDGILLVISRNQSKRGPVSVAMEQLSYINASILGVVVNRAEKQRQDQYYNIRAMSPTPLKSGNNDGEPPKRRVNQKSVDAPQPDAS